LRCSILFNPKQEKISLLGSSPLAESLFFESGELLLMTSKALLFFLLSGTVCAGQSVLTTPVAGVPSIAGSELAPAAGTARTPMQRQAQVSAYPAPGAIAPEAPSVNDPEAPTPRPTTVKAAGPLAAKSEFQQFAEDATGRLLPVYGRQLFDEVPTTFAPLQNVPVPADYVLGPGDQLLVRAWGKIDLDSRMTVDRNGQINLPKVGTVTVAGLRYAQVEKYLHSAIGALFKDFELNVALGQLRSIQIFVLGNARQPGAYTIGSLSTMVDALFASGGPSATGTMRHILLRREDRVIADFDLYDLIEKGDKSRDARLQPGDVIFIPSIGPQIAISGDVNQPGIYELKGETTVEAALENAGGMTSLADAERAVLERIEKHSSRKVEEFALDGQGRARMIKDGDLLRIFPLSSKFSNAVTLRGNVAQPGLYQSKDGMRISDLIPSRGFLITRDYWNRQNHLVRPGPDHPFAGRPLDAPGDQRTDESGNPRTDAFGNPRTDAFGSQRMDAFGNQRMDQPGETDFRTTASIGQNSAEINWEYALIERLDERDLSTHLIPFNLGNALDNPASADNQALKPGDVVSIFSRADLELPMEKHTSFVRVGGEVNAPGVYRVNPGDTLRDVVEKAGGLTPHSYLYASIFTRVSTRVAQEAQLRQSSEQMQKELISKYANAAPQAGQTGTEQQSQLAMQQAALAKLASIKPTGRVVLDMKPEAESITDIPAFPLEDGDVFYVSPRLSTVQVAGAVYNANAFRYDSERRLIAYLNAAGGATREADKKRIYVIRADGTVVSRQSRNMHSHGKYENLRLLPGDAIIVPEKLRVSSPMSAFLQATQLASQLALTAASLSVVK
jgi:polysaccharide biosynthesis/export protein